MFVAYKYENKMYFYDPSKRRYYGHPDGESFKDNFLRRDKIPIHYYYAVIKDYHNQEDVLLKDDKCPLIFMLECKR